MQKDIDSIHRIISQFLRERQLYSFLSSSACHLLRRELAKRSVDVFSITSRQKSLPSLLEKLSRKSYGDFSDITDCAGVRVICPNSNSIPEVLSVIRDIFLVEEFEDTTTRGGLSSFGYSSFHFLVRWNPQYEGPFLTENMPFLTYGDIDGPEAKFALDSFRDELISISKRKNQDAQKLLIEIQIRTILQHAWSSISHHVLYKYKIDISEDRRRRFARLAAILEEIDAAFAEEIQKGVPTCNLNRPILPQSDKPLSHTYLQNYSKSVFDKSLPKEKAEFALRISKSIGLKTARQFEEIMVSILEALDVAFSDILLSHLKSLDIYLLALSLWVDGGDIGLPESQQNIIKKCRNLVCEEVFQSVVSEIKG